MVSLQSTNSQGQSQPVYRAALTKRKKSGMFPRKQLLERWSGVNAVVPHDADCNERVGLLSLLRLVHVYHTLITTVENRRPF